MALRAIAVRCVPPRTVDALRAIVGVRVAPREATAERDVAVVTGVRVTVVVRDETLPLVRADAVLDVSFWGCLRDETARSRIVWVGLDVAFVVRDMSLFCVGVLVVFDFFRVDVIVFVVPRRTAARTASSDSVAHTSPNPSNARHTAKITLVPFILIWISVANL